jgi:hypothetical protein
MWEIPSSGSGTTRITTRSYRRKSPRKGYPVTVEAISSREKGDQLAARQVPLATHSIRHLASLTKQAPGVHGTQKVYFTANCRMRGSFAD